jgi:hypothetical protein
MPGSSSTTKPRSLDCELELALGFATGCINPPENVVGERQIRPEKGNRV